MYCAAFDCLAMQFDGRVHPLAPHISLPPMHTNFTMRSFSLRLRSCGLFAALVTVARLGLIQLLTDVSTQRNAAFRCGLECKLACE